MMMFVCLPLWCFKNFTRKNIFHKNEIGKLFFLTPGDDFYMFSLLASVEEINLGNGIHYVERKNTGVYKIYLKGYINMAYAIKIIFSSLNINSHQPVKIVLFSCVRFVCCIISKCQPSEIEWSHLRKWIYVGVCVWGKP